MEINPTAFISYAWESDELKAWVKDLAIKLRQKGVDVKLDQWEVAPGDQMPYFMEKSVRDNRYVLIICTPKYKIKSENREGGVGYEGDIMTAEVLQSSNHKKFIPILTRGTRESAIPSWLSGKYYLDFSSTAHFEKNFSDLITTLLNARELAPILGSAPSALKTAVHREENVLDSDSIRICGIKVDEVSEPLNDGTMGSALYNIPFELNRQPDNLWCELFVESWNWPPTFSTMHRPGIASVYGKKIVLQGTTIEEVERYHRDTLQLAVKEANAKWDEIQRSNKRKEEIEKKMKEEHKKNVEDVSKRIKFD